VITLGLTLLLAAVSVEAEEQSPSMRELVEADFLRQAEALMSPPTANTRAASSQVKTFQDD
jgi:hypothetical protein